VHATNRALNYEHAAKLQQHKMLTQDMVLIVQDYDASSSTISHACEVRIGAKCERRSGAEQMQKIQKMQVGQKNKIAIFTCY